jgi:hypothetical protein
MNEPNFYATMAQVIPVLLLSVIWDAGYLDRIARGAADNHRIWKRPQIRIWLSTILPLGVGAEIASVLAIAVRGLQTWVVGTAVLLASIGLIITLLIRMLSDVYRATSPIGHRENL